MTRHIIPGGPFERLAKAHPLIAGRKVAIVEERRGRESSEGRFPPPRKHERRLSLGPPLTPHGSGGRRRQRVH